MYLNAPRDRLSSNVPQLTLKISLRPYLWFKRSYFLKLAVVRKWDRGIYFERTNFEFFTQGRLKNSVKIKLIMNNKQL